MKLRSKLYKAARVLGDVEAVSSGKPKRVAKRGVNKLIGRLIVGKFWRRG